MAPTYVVVYNTTDTPALLDEAGHTLGGHEWGPARRGATLDAAANRGHVVALTTIARDGASRDALRAADLVDKWNEASRAYDGAELDALRESAAELVDPDGVDAAELDRADLVDLLIRADVAPPAAPSPTKAARPPRAQE